MLNREQQPVVQLPMQPVVGTQPFCVRYRLAGTATERCLTATYYLGAPPTPSNEFWTPLLETTKRIIDCYNSVKVGDPLPDCWR